MIEICKIHPDRNVFMSRLFVYLLLFLPALQSAQAAA